jgi:AcrR family transcriptional regulator
MGRSEPVGRQETLKRRRGRPPASTSATTKARIIAAARACFARDGYDKTTNKEIAEAAGLTTGAIYHYFDSKPALFAAVAAETFELIRSEFLDALQDAEPTFVGQVTAVWDRAAALHASDRSYAGFAMISPIERARHDEIPAELEGHAPHEVLREIVTNARARGELAVDVDDDTVLSLLVVITIGLAQAAAASESVDDHRRTTAAFRRVLDGSLLTPLATAAEASFGTG